MRRGSTSSVRPAPPAWAPGSHWSSWRIPRPTARPPSTSSPAAMSRSPSRSGRARANSSWWTCAMTDRAENEPARLVLVSGHVFGLRAFEGIVSSPARLAGQIEVPLMIGLDESRAAHTVGYRSLAGLAAEQGARHVSTSDGRLGSLAGQIRAARPAYLLVIGWSHLIPDEILSIPAAIAVRGGAGPGGAGPGGSGCIGMHPTKLPGGRGQAPIPWT